MRKPIELKVATTSRSWRRRVVVGGLIGSVAVGGGLAFTSAARGSAPYDKRTDTASLEPLTGDQLAAAQQRSAQYPKDFEDFLARRDVWIKNFAASGVDVSTLPVAQLNSDDVPGAPTLDAAVRQATFVLDGDVTDLHFTGAGTIVTMKVRQAVKGNPGDVINFIMPGGPEMGTTANSSGVLAVDASVPYLFKGTHAIVLLDGHVQNGKSTLDVQPDSGSYVIHNGYVTPAPHNQFGSRVRGVSDNELIASMRAAALAQG